MRRKIYQLALVLAPLLLAAGAVWGESGARGYPDRGVVGSGYEPDRQIAGFRTGLSTADTLTTAAILATPEFQCYGRPTIPLSARFSASGATCKIRLAYVYKTDSKASATDATKNFIKGFSPEVTLTAGTVQYEGAYYPPVAGDYLFDSEGAVTCRVLITGTTSSGTVDLWPGSE